MNNKKMTETKKEKNVENEKNKIKIYTEEYDNRKGKRRNERK